MFVWVCIFECQYLQKPEEDTRFPRAGVTGIMNCQTWVPVAEPRSSQEWYSLLMLSYLLPQIKISFGNFWIQALITKNWVVLLKTFFFFCLCVELE